MKDKDKPYFEAKVYSHDAPTGEFYTIIPASYLEDVFEKDSNLKETVLNLMEKDEDVELFAKKAVQDYRPFHLPRTREMGLPNHYKNDTI